MLQECSIKVTATVFVADDVRRRLGSVIVRNFINNFAEEAYRNMREGCAFRAVVFDKVIELGRKDKPRADQ
jgi:hypothetical protein